MRENLKYSASVLSQEKKTKTLLHHVLLTCTLLVSCSHPSRLGLIFWNLILLMNVCTAVLFVGSLLFLIEVDESC